MNNRNLCAVLTTVVMAGAAPTGAQTRVADHGSATARPISNPGEWVTTADYPGSALRELREGTTAFRLTVGLDGRVSGCQIISSSGSPALDETTCRVATMRARFDPARNAKGQPVIGAYTNRLRWVIPKGNPGSMAATLLLPSSKTMAFTVAADGNASDCVVEIDGKALSLDTTPNFCAFKGSLPPYHDAQGRAVPKRVIVRYTITVEDLPGASR